LDVGPLRAFLEADAPRVNCRIHGPTVAEVPWARHGAGHTRVFDDLAAWLAVHTSKTAVVELLRVAWRTVGAIVDRVVADARAAADPLEGLVRIGIDDISYKRGQRYLLVVVDHDTGRVVWVGKERHKATLEAFFDQLGPARAAQIQLVSADAAGWIGRLAADRCPHATICIDPFHVVAWMTDALDEVRRQAWNELRQAGLTADARRLKTSRWALAKNPDRLTDRQQAKLARIAQHNEPLYRAYLLKEQLREVFALAGDDGVALLDEWLAWARRCRIQQVVEVAQRIARHRPGIEASLQHHMSNGLVESTNTKIRLLTRIAYGFANPDHLIALIHLDRGGYRPPLPAQ
jgi:transposase